MCAHVVEKNERGLQIERERERENNQKIGIVSDTLHYSTMRTRKLEIGFRRHYFRAIYQTAAATAVTFLSYSLNSTDNDTEQKYVNSSGRCCYTLSNSSSNSKGDDSKNSQKYNKFNIYYKKNTKRKAIWRKRDRAPEKLKKKRHNEMLLLLMMTIIITYSKGKLMQEKLKQTDRNGNDTPILAMISFIGCKEKTELFLVSSFCGWRISVRLFFA